MMDLRTTLRWMNEDHYEDTQWYLEIRLKAMTYAIETGKRIGR